jgi:hypothetical protein
MDDSPPSNRLPSNAGGRPLANVSLVNSTRLCAIYLHDVFGFLSREKCEEAKQVSANLNDAFTNCPTGCTPRWKMDSVSVSCSPSSGPFPGNRSKAALHRNGGGWLIYDPEHDLSTGRRLSCCAGLQVGISETDTCRRLLVSAARNRSTPPNSSAS